MQGNRRHTRPAIPTFHSAGMVRFLRPFVCCCTFPSLLLSISSALSTCALSKAPHLFALWTCIYHTAICTGSISILSTPMVTGLYKRAHGRASSTSGWRLPSIPDNLALPKPQQHHIVHTNMQEEMSKLNDYLQFEASLNSCAPLSPSGSCTPELASGIESRCPPPGKQPSKASRRYTGFASSLQLERHLQMAKCSHENSSPLSPKSSKGIRAFSDAVANNDGTADVNTRNGNFSSSSQLNSGCSSPSRGHAEAYNTSDRPPPRLLKSSSSNALSQAACMSPSVKQLVPARMRASSLSPRGSGLFAATRHSNAGALRTPERAPSMMNGCQASLSLSNSAVKPSQQLGAVPENDGALQNEYVFLDASAIIAMYADDGPDISDQRYGEAPYKASLNGGSAAAINTVPNSPTPSSAKSSTTVGSTQDVELTKLNMGLSPAPSDVALNPSYYDKVTEMVVDRILKDCDLMDALTVPLPSTPNPQFPRAAVPSNPRLNVGGSDDSLSTSRSAFESKRQQNLDGNKAAGTGLEQSAPPSQHMPWFSQLDMEAHCKRYEDCLVQQKEMHEIHISSLKDEHALNMRAQEQQARQDLAEAEVRFRQQFAEKEREFAQRLAAEQQAHMKSINLREEEANAQATQLDSEIAKMKAEHGELRTMLDEYVATSTVLLEQKDAETNALSAELRRLTLNHQQLREELSGSTARVAALSGERDETQERLELLVTENMRLEELNGALRGDVLVAEERNMKIRRHAEDTLSKANAEVGSLCEQLVESRKDVAALKTQAAKADARARSLQIQLDSLKRQNSELLELCERL